MSQTILSATSSNFSALSRVVYNRLSTAAGPRIIASVGSRVITRGMADVGSGLGSHMTDNDEEAIKKAKLRQFKGRSEVSIPDVAGWSEDLASFSEAAVKADRYVGNVPISRLQEVSLSALDQRMRNEEADFQCMSPNYPSQKSKTDSSGMNSTSSNESNAVGGSSSSSTSTASSTMNAAINAFREKVLSVIANPSSSGSKSSSPSSASESTEKKSLKAREAECGSNAFEYDSPALRENLDYTLSDGEKNMGRRSGM